jgi:hypothetical protein
MEIWIEDPIATPKDRSSLSFMANMIAPACSAAFPTIGSKMVLIKAIGIFHETEAP